jgi:hypothetical protein
LSCGLGLGAGVCAMTAVVVQKTRRKTNNR